MAKFYFVSHFLLLGFVWSSSVLATETTTVTTFIKTTQEERQSTRWTLTEWLRIKERMKMMDVWLAMVSEPKKDQFHPELELMHSVTQGNFNGNDVGSTATSSGRRSRAQLWLTNLISSTLGVRTLNIDFGGEYFRVDDKLSLQGGLPGYDLSLAAYGAAFRIFGKNIQDSSIVFKFGEYQHQGKSAAAAELSSGSDFKLLGKYAGAELQLYVLSWLGLQANGYGFQSKQHADRTHSGGYVDYGAFVEVSIIRITGGAMEQRWKDQMESATTNTRLTGKFVGLGLSF